MIYFFVKKYGRDFIYEFFPKEKVNKLETTMEERKIIERAKGILMERENLTEREAFRIIQKNSMDTGSKMIDVAGNIIIQYSL